MAMTTQDFSPAYWTQEEYESWLEELYTKEPRFKS